MSFSSASCGILCVEFKMCFIERVGRFWTKVESVGVEYSSERCKKFRRSTSFNSTTLYLIFVHCLSKDKLISCRTDRWIFVFDY